jgi:hypothetical protein
MDLDFISPVEYKFVIRVLYDKEYDHQFIFTNIIDAFKKFESFTDSGDAKEFATYTLTEPNSRETTKTIYKDGKVAIK